MSKAAAAPSLAELQAMFDYQGFRGRRKERERIVAHIERLAKSQETTFVGWSVRLYALAKRIRDLRIPRPKGAKARP